MTVGRMIAMMFVPKLQKSRDPGKLCLVRLGGDFKSTRWQGAVKRWADGLEARISL